MGLTGKLIAQIEFKHGGDVFHDLFKHKPHHISNVIPHTVQGCDLLEGEFGKVGSKINWNYTHDGKKKKAKQLIEAMEEEKKLIKFKMLEGDLMDEYKDFTIILHIETKGQIDLVTWTLEYEMLNEDVPHPISLLAYFIGLTKDIETKH
ncbi:Polyketide cyclase/dehydrase and lipid transport superfamily protein [Abeliophyllum distichum]|uniref:Polyketide cyclase/dehydrase and lipid transport superfamily protein n=1 Tax=Abeliophyllum distichum TaxID=126358 RepID=A0ABD1VV72_9LAMI